MTHLRWYPHEQLNEGHGPPKGGWYCPSDDCAHPNSGDMRFCGWCGEEWSPDAVPMKYEDYELEWR